MKKQRRFAKKSEHDKLSKAHLRKWQEDAAYAERQLKAQQRRRRRERKLKNAEAKK